MRMRPWNEKAINIQLCESRLTIRWLGDINIELCKIDTAEHCRNTALVTSRPINRDFSAKGNYAEDTVQLGKQQASSPLLIFIILNYG
jgi:hypothetical protein